VVISQIEAYWSIPNDSLIHSLNTTSDGLSSIDANNRLIKYGINVVDYKRKTGSLSLFLSQFKSPIILIFLATAFLSFILQAREDALIIISIVLISSFLGYWQERGASKAMDKLASLIKIKSAILRDGIVQDISSEDVVAGDIVILNSGDKIPADCKILECKDLFVNEGTLTGESYPVEKSSELIPKDTPLRSRVNSLFMGTFVVSGTAKALVICTGTKTEFGSISSRLRHIKPETEFQSGIRRFGFFLLEITLLLVVGILVINIYFGRPVLDSFLFSLALAIGLTPQLLPAIISVNLSHGARRMANEKVIVKRLESIENLGTMDVLCTDKTGTITTGELRLHSCIDVTGKNNKKIFLYGYLNALFETGYSNPIDRAIKEYKETTDEEINSDEVSSQFTKLDEIPYDFIRKRLSILVCRKSNDSADIKSNESQNQYKKKILITKGALHNILEISTFVETANGKVEMISTFREKISNSYRELGDKGFRVLGIAYKVIQETTSSSPSSSTFPSDYSTSTGRLSVSVNKDDESNMTFLGFLVFYDPLKPGLLKTLIDLRRMGVSLKVISGDNRYVAEYVGKQIGLTNPVVLIGEELHHMNTDALVHKAANTEIFAEIEPNQKELIILALKKMGHVVGYMGDGINDAPALHAADTSISVDSATDVVKEAADFVLLEKDLAVLKKGIEEGRRTFANTLKYVFMATSANFGNMFSMAGASLFLPFLPLLPKQVLLVNLMTDMPEMTISTDTVDEEMVEKPRKWDIKFIRRFMLYFGLLSTFFDYITFAVLLIVLNASVEQFRTAWFMESVISASAIVLIIRTRKRAYKSKPSKYLVLFTFATTVLVILIPYTPIGEIFGFVRVPLIYLLIIGLIVLAYISMAEMVKMRFYRKNYN
jgi:Mg2+-importing ATPase